jgi:hypothetical protein
MKKCVCLFILSFIFLPLDAPAQVTFERTYGGGDEDEGFSVHQTTDGGYIVAGYTSSFGAGQSDVYLIKTDSLGDTLWTRTYGGTLSDSGLSVVQTQDNGYVISGSTVPFGSSWPDVYLIKINPSGDTLWTRTYGGSHIDGGNSVQQTTDGGYAIAGWTASFGAGGLDAYLVKTDSSGDTLWTKTYGGPYYDRAWSMQQTADHGYILFGFTGSFGAGYYDFYLIKTDSLGDTIWTRTYGTGADDWGYSVQQTPDGGYILAGAITGLGFYDLYLIKTDSLGDTLWTRTYGTSSLEGARSIQSTLDSGYVIAGITSSFGAGSYDVYLLKTDSSGDTLWTGAYGGTEYDEGFSVQQTSDGGYIVAGRTDSFGAGDYDVYLIKTDQNGNVAVAEGSSTELSKPLLYQSYPNPFNSTTTICFNVSSAMRGRVNLVIHDICGRHVKTLIDTELEPGTHQVIWDRSDYKGTLVSSGIYFCMLMVDGKTYMQKMMVLS